MRESTKKFLRANRRNFQSKMKSWEYTPEGMKPGQARREILADLQGKLIDLGRKDKDLFILESLEFKEFHTIEGRSYWRLCPTFETIYRFQYDQFEAIARGEYIPAGGQKVIDSAKKLLSLPIVKVSL